MEIEAETNIPAAQAILRVQEIVQSSDIWTEHERFILHLRELYDLKDTVSAQVSAGADAKDVANMIRVFDQIRKTLELLNKTNIDLADTVSKAQAAHMMRFIVAAYDYAMAELEREYPDVDRSVIDAKFREGLATVAVSDDD